MRLASRPSPVLAAWATSLVLGFIVAPATAQEDDRVAIEFLLSFAGDEVVFVIDTAASGAAVADLPSAEAFQETADAALLAVGGATDDEDYSVLGTESALEEGHRVVFPPLEAAMVVRLLGQIPSARAALGLVTITETGPDQFFLGFQVRSVRDVLGSAPPYPFDVVTVVETQDGDIVSVVGGTDLPDGAAEFVADPTEVRLATVQIATTDEAFALAEAAPPATAAAESGGSQAESVADADPPSTPVSPGDGGGLPIWAFVVAGLLLLVIIGLVIALVSRSGGRPSGGPGASTGGYGGGPPGVVTGPPGLQPSGQPAGPPGQTASTAGGPPPG